MYEKSILMSLINSYVFSVKNYDHENLMEL